MQDRRIGQFRIAKDFIETHPQVVQMLFGSVIPIRCELMAYSGELEYVGLSSHFDALPQHLAPPYYDALFETLRDHQGEPYTVFQGFRRIR